MSSWSSLYAHTLTDPDTGERTPQSEWETLEEHANKVAELCGKFASAFGSGEVGRIIGKVHDAGKARESFQKYLSGNGYSTPHAYTGANWLDENIIGLGRLLAYTVAGHHTGLPDGVGDAKSLSSHLAEEKKTANVEVPETPPGNPRAMVPSFLMKDANRKAALWIRMLFSSLVDADWLATEAFMNPKRAYARPDTFSSIEALWEQYQTFMEEKQKTAPDTEVNRLRRNIREYALEKADEPRGLFSMTVPTGGGKTLSSLGFALKHALKHGLNKIIYVIPYSTIIEQTSDVLQTVFGETQDDAINVLEHHAEAKWREEDGVHASALRQLTENWDGVPIVVTTNVQFFESFFSAEPSRCRKLHNVANSVIILDEAQKLPENFLAPCSDLLRQLQEDYGCSILFCTATQPDLQSFGIKGLCEIAPDPKGLYNALRRVDYHDLGKFESWNQLAEHIAQQQSALCVVNTRKDARDLFAEIAKRKGEEAYHLSTWMCPQHRRDVITTIRERLKQKLPTYVISTSLIEAGVDLDFPVAYRALAGLDSLAQTAGRCNREGKQAGHGQIYYFESPNPPPGSMLKAFQTSKRMGDLTLAAHSPDTFRTYFSNYYFDINDNGQDIVKRLKVTDSDGKELPFRDVSEKIHLIDEAAVWTVFVPYGNATSLLDKAIETGLSKTMLRSLRGAVIHVHEREYNQLKLYGKLLRVFDLETQTMVESPYLAMINLKGVYDAKTGLNISFNEVAATDLQV